MTQAERVVNKLALRISELEKDRAILSADLEIAHERIKELEENRDAKNIDQPAG